MAWDQRFAEPIALPGRKPLVTVRDAGRYIAELPESEQRLAHWQAATEILLLFAEANGDPMMARIAMLRALNHGRAAPAIEPRRTRARAYKVIRSTA